MPADAASASVAPSLLPPIDMKEPIKSPPLPNAANNFSGRMTADKRTSPDINIDLAGKLTALQGQKQTVEQQTAVLRAA